MATPRSGLMPVRQDDVYAFVVVDDDAGRENVPFVGAFREREGLTVIVPEEVAVAAGWVIRFRAAWLTLEAETKLEDVGVTAAVSRALEAAAIPCNVMAGVHHDHLFVPVDRADEALVLLRAI